MRKMKVTGTGFYVPARVVANDFFVSDLGLATTAEWIEKKTGIVERRFAGPAQATAEMATLAAMQAISDDPAVGRVGMIVLATSTPDVFIPCTAAIVQSRLCQTKAVAVEVNNACTGFITALDIASRYLDTYERILVIGADTATRVVDCRHRETAVFFGDGAGAVLVERTECDIGIMATVLRTEGDEAALCVPGGGSRNRFPEDAQDNWMRMDGKLIWEFATRAFPEAVRDVCVAAGVSLSDVDWVVPHQANANIIRESMRRLEMPYEKAVVNIHKYGNTISASVPIAFHEAVADGRIRPGHKVVLVGYGAGLAWGAILIQL